jgi:hypothetical protein
LVELDGGRGGYPDAVHRGDLWLIRYGASQSERRNIARVRSRIEPRIVYASDNSLLIGHCCSAQGEYGVSAFSVSGHRLWMQHWLPPYSMVVTRSEDGGRFAVSTVIPRRASAPAKTEDEDDSSPPFQQDVRVFETASGNLVGSWTASPVVMTRQNYSLSPGGASTGSARGVCDRGSRTAATLGRGAGQTCRPQG